MAVRLFFLIVSLFTLSAHAHQPSRNTLDDTLDREGCVTNEQSKVRICKCDYLADGKKIEAFTIRPLADGKYPGLVLLAEKGRKLSSLWGRFLHSRVSPLSR